MNKSRSLIKRLIAEEEAATAVEYGLITAVIALGLVGALIVFRGQLANWFQQIGTDVAAAGQ